MNKSKLSVAMLALIAAGASAPVIALADAITANDAADRLRRKIASIRRELAASETSRVSADAARRQTAAETANLFADLYEESDRRAGEIARYADAAASAGRVCERTYEAVTRSVE